MGMDFSIALDRLKEGCLVTRDGWHGVPRFIYLVRWSTFEVSREPLNETFDDGTEVTYSPHIDACVRGQECATWHPTHIDLLSEDWMIVNAPALIED